MFFGVVIAYSFIIGRNQTLKVIMASYVAIICSDGLGNLFAKYFASSQTFLKFLKLFAISNADQATAFFKVLLLIVLIVIIAVRGLFTFDAEDGGPVSIKLAIVLILGLLSAGLMMSAMLIFVSGGSMVSNVFMVSNPLTAVYGQSRLVRIMVEYSNIWFMLPGLALVLLSYFRKK